MEKDVLDYVIEKTQELISAPTCSAETKAAAQAWLDTVGTDRQADETKKCIAKLEAHILGRKPPKILRLTRNSSKRRKQSIAIVRLAWLSQQFW